MVGLRMLIYDIIMISYVLIGVLIFIPPLLLSMDRVDTGYISISDSIHTFFSFFCHQLPWRSIFINGIKMPVCARCASIYIATGLGLIYFRLKGFGIREFKMNWVILALLFAPTGVDGMTQLLGYRESTNLLRVITGFPYGLGYAYIITWALPLIYALIELLRAALEKEEDHARRVLDRIKKMVWPLI